MRAKNRGKPVEGAELPKRSTGSELKSENIKKTLLVAHRTTQGHHHRWRNFCWNLFQSNHPFVRSLLETILRSSLSRDQRDLPGPVGGEHRGPNGAHHVNGGI